jgi:hypothetical protein
MVSIAPARVGEQKKYMPGVSARSSPILCSSSCGLGPSPNCVMAPFREASGVGVAALELRRDVRPLVGWAPLRGTGGADMGRVLMCSVGKALLLAWGRTSSRLTGMPSMIKCCLRIRERVQLGGCADGGDFWRIESYSARLLVCELPTL